MAAPLRQHRQQKRISDYRVGAEAHAEHEDDDGGCHGSMTRPTRARPRGPNACAADKAIAWTLPHAALVPDRNVSGKQIRILRASDRGVALLFREPGAGTCCPLGR